MEIIHSISSTSIENFDHLKASIKRTSFPVSGENLIDLAADFSKAVDELEIAGQYDHNVTLCKVDTFLKAG